jgi:hypothetical protein
MPFISACSPRPLFWSVLGTSLIGCATQAGYDAQLRAMMGNPEPAVIQAWGPPASVSDRDGTRILSYTRGSMADSSRARTYNPMAPTGGGMVRILSGGSIDGTAGLWCTTHVYITDGRVSRYTHEGNDCRA